MHSDGRQISPRHEPGVQKLWWTDGLTNLRRRSIEIRRLWQAERKSLSGPTNFERLKIKSEYERAIRNMQKAPNSVPKCSLVVKQKDNSGSPSKCICPFCDSRPFLSLSSLTINKLDIKEGLKAGRIHT